MAVSPLRPQGPPLNALRAFETAARLGGFAAAAEELCVTPGAVAQHVKTLESWADALLFERRSQGVRLTAIGEHVLADFVSAFDQLGMAIQKLRTSAAPKDVRIAALPSIAQLWLSARLPAIRSAALPGVTVSVTAMERPPNLGREPFDLSIFFEDNPIASSSVELCPDVIFPVCAPVIGSRLKSSADLADETYLNDLSWPNDWNIWISSALPDARLDPRGPVFSLYSLAVEEALNGAGVLIGHESLVSSHLESGALVVPFEYRVTLPRALSLTAQKHALNNPSLAKIIDTIVSSAAPGEHDSPVL